MISFEVLCAIILLNGHIYDTMANTMKTDHANIDSLAHVHAIWRHGDRTPIYFIPTDHMNDEASWKIGSGELTTKGITEHYQLGNSLRLRYKGFLKKYTAREVYVRSTDYNRTLMSAQANLAGLFPPVDDQVWCKDIPWQPIPVHTCPVKEDKLLSKAYCPRAKEEAKIFFANDPNVLKLEAENKDLFEFLRINGGYSKFSFTNISKIYDPLMVQSHHLDAHPFPSWFNMTIWRKVASLYDSYSLLPYRSTVYTKLRCGLLVKEIRDRVLKIAENASSSGLKFNIYSAHDRTLIALLAALGVKLTTNPGYAAVVLIELHRGNNDFYLQLYYKNSTESPLFQQYPISSCEDPCTVSKFAARLAQYIFDDWEKECGIKSSNVV